MSKNKLKKNTIGRHEKFKSMLDIILKLKEVFVILAAVFLWVLGIWLAYKLAPIRDDLKSIAAVVEANTSRIENNEDTYTAIDSKLDTLIIDMAIITGILKGKEIIR